MEPAATVVDQAPNDEIDLREVWSAIGRRRFWPLGGLLIGLTLGAATQFLKPISTATYSVAVTFDLTQLPQKQLPLREIAGLPEELRNQYQIQLPGLETTKYLYTKAQFANQLLTELPSFIPQKQQSNWKLRETTAEIINASKGKPHKFAVENSLSLVNQSFQSESDALKASAFLNSFIKSLKQSIFSEDLQAANFDNGAIESLASDIQIKQLPPKNSLSSRSLALGALAGLVIGTGGGLMADRRTGKEYSKEQLKRLLPYRTAVELPAMPWEAGTAQQAIGTLDAVLNPAKSWLLTSVGSSHPAVSLLHEAIESTGSNLTITVQPPLLSHPLPRYTGWANQGLLIVVEPGFNTRSALQQVQQLLSQLPQTVDIRLVMVGTPIPSDCVPNS